MSRCAAIMGLKQPRALSASRSDHPHAFSCCNQPPPRPADLGGERYSGGKSPPGIGLDNLTAMCYHVRATTAEAGKPAPPAAPTRPRKRPESTRRHGLTTSAAALQSAPFWGRFFMRIFEGFMQGNLFRLYPFSVYPAFARNDLSVSLTENRAK